MSFLRKASVLAIVAGSVAAVPASATLLVPGSSGVAFSAFNAATQGTLLASANALTSPATTFTGSLQTAVYRNTLGTLDFYYQFTHASGEPVEFLTGSSFIGYFVDALVSSADPDGASPMFVTGTNGLPEATVGRSNTGGVLTVNLTANPVAGSEVTSTYIFRTDATNYSSSTAGAIDGSGASYAGFQPASPVPEPATWAMMVGGFGLLGATMRRRRSVSTKVTFG